MRERIRVDPIGITNSSKAVVAFINDESYEKAMKNFNTKAIGGYSLELRPHISKDSNKKIFIKGLKPSVTENDLEKIFGTFGKVTEKSIKKAYQVNAIIGFEDE